MSRVDHDGRVVEYCAAEPSAGYSLHSKATNMKIYLCGHGNHHMENGFFTLPKGTTVTFYTLAAKLIHQKDTEAIVTGKADLTAARVVEEFRSCPNLTLTCDSEKDKNATLVAFKDNPNRDNCKLFFVNDLVKGAGDDSQLSVNLKEIVEASPGHDFIWACCYHIPLQKTLLGSKYGMNVIQYIPGGEMHKAKTKKGGGDLEINRGDLVLQIRALLKKNARELNTKDALAYLDKLDSPSGLPQRR
jgi:hypothetical protein